ncbi:ABC transporter ATP-binding protein [Oricola sp.]|uniref:ABC transporter ATP-binding protein n=1 Tax=Oricola sp. TaxID=1979950 RepID=UPI003BAD7E2F
MAQFDIVKLCKSYGTLKILKDIDLVVENGEFLVLVGPSGSGKSTLLRIIAGLEEATSGVIAHNGEPKTNLPPQELNLAMVFQDYALYPHMTVRQNMGFGLKIRGQNKTEIERRVNEAARMLALEEYLERRPSALSGGQRQRVAMGRAIVRQPVAYLFDEPLSNLDAKLRVEMRSEIVALQKRVGATTIYVTHDQVEAMTMGDRIVLLKDGRIEQIGPPMELYLKPRNLFVARFIGTPPMNIIDTGSLVEPSPALANLIAKTGARFVGLRPEHLSLASSSEFSIGVSDATCHPVGATTQLVGMNAGNQVEAALPGIVHAPGDKATLFMDEKDIYIFGEDEQRIEPT